MRREGGREEDRRKEGGNVGEGSLAHTFIKLNTSYKMYFEATYSF